MLTADDLKRHVKESAEEELADLLIKMEAYAKSGKLGYPVKYIHPVNKLKLEEMGFEFRNHAYSEIMYVIWWGA